MTELRIGDPVQIDETTEVLTLVCLDGEYAWVRDGAGNHITHKLVDLARPKLRRFRYQEWTTQAEWQRPNTTVQK